MYIMDVCKASTMNCIFIIVSISSQAIRILQKSGAVFFTSCSPNVCVYWVKVWLFINSFIGGGGGGYVALLQTLVHAAFCRKKCKSRVCSCVLGRG